jgi:ATP-dependent Clp endopeptidase proteolytic subunit ClpP
MTSDDTSSDVRQLHPAEIQKLEAEAAAALALAEKTKSEAVKADLEAEAERIKLRKAQREEAKALAEDEHHYIYTFGESVSDASVNKCIKQLNNWIRGSTGPLEIEIVFNSPGGSVIAGLALWDYIQSVKAQGHFVTTAAIGYAASMAGILLQAGNKRVMGKEAWLMIHEASFGAGGKIGEVEDTVDWVKRVQERFLAIFAERSTLTKNQIRRRWTRKDWWLDSDEALRLGFVDEVR